MELVSQWVVVQVNFARARERDDILSVTNYTDKITNNVGSLVTKLHAIFSYSVHV